MEGKFSKLLLVIVCSALLSTCSLLGTPVVEPSPSSNATPRSVLEVVKPDLPKTVWEPVFYEAIDKRTKAADIVRLRDASIGENDIEVRIWGGFGLSRLRGVILSRKDGNWLGLHLFFDWQAEKPGERTMTLRAPISGWDQMWRSLVDNKILTLPDAATIGCSTSDIDDGFSYVVEMKKGSNYRTYMYDNPTSSFKNRCKEADEILTIANILSDELGIAQFEQTRE